MVFPIPQVTTIRWADTIENYPDLGENHTVQEFTFDNSDGSLPMMTQGRHARHDVEEVHQYPPIRYDFQPAAKLSGLCQRLC